jgi:hypothetical protein
VRASQGGCRILVGLDLPPFMGGLKIMLRPRLSAQDMRKAIEGAVSIMGDCPFALCDFKEAEFDELADRQSDAVSAHASGNEVAVWASQFPVVESAMP